MAFSYKYFLIKQLKPDYAGRIVGILRVGVFSREPVVTGFVVIELPFGHKQRTPAERLFSISE